MNAFLRYTVLRLLVFLGSLLALWLAGLRGREDLLLLVAGAALLSMVLSFVVLKRFREDYSAQLAESIARRTAARRDKDGEAASDEDAEDAETSRSGDPAADEDFR